VTKISQLLILSSKNDLSATRLIKEGQKLTKVSHYLYNDLTRKSLPLPKIPSGKNVALLARQPYVANAIEHSADALLHMILSEFSFASVFDDKLYQQSFMRYEDKLYQSYVLQKLELPFAQLWNTTKPKAIVFPIIAKKRISSRHNANYVLHDRSELQTFMKDFDTAQYIFQTYFPLKADYRILICKGKLLGTVARDAWLEEGNKTIVKVAGATEVPSKIAQQAIKLSDYIGCDLCGIDVGETETGDFFFIEYNPSPQFLGFERETGRNIAEAVIKSLLT